ncbi:MAG: DUF6391 domain-containing protein [Dehalococcoidia bacterium]
MAWPSRKPPKEHFHGSPKKQALLLDMVRVLRQNHAMEHATINVLLKQLSRKVRLLGYTSLAGFYIVGDISTETLEQSAREALRQLQEGKKEIAISPMCGTNLVVTGLVAGAASMIAGRGHSGWSRFQRMATASMIGAILAQPLGLLAQKHITTDAGQADVTSLRVTRRGGGMLTWHKVEILRS